jgi:hypothetical protein
MPLVGGFSRCVCVSWPPHAATGQLEGGRTPCAGSIHQRTNMLRVGVGVGSKGDDLSDPCPRAMKPWSPLGQALPSSLEFLQPPRSRPPHAHPLPSPLPLHPPCRSWYAFHCGCCAVVMVVVVAPVPPQVALAISRFEPVTLAATATSWSVARDMVAAKGALATAGM